MIDFDLVREYYFKPPPADPLAVPSDEELIARHERQRYERCVLRLGDPVAEGLGPHGSMIGGPGKPVTIHHQRAERCAPILPLPLAWWDYPRARRAILPSGGEEEARSYLRCVIGAHLAGVPNKPSASALGRIFRNPAPSGSDRDILIHLLRGLPSPRFKTLATLGGISLYELARAVHVTRSRRNAFIRWLHRFAIPPRSAGTA